MKRPVIISSLSLLLAVSCVALAPEGNDDSFKTNSGPIVVRSSPVVELSDPCFVTQKMAELFITSYKENAEIVSIEPYEVDGVVCLYIINFENGYKIISADTRIQPILAECDEGSLYPEETDNPGVIVWLEDTADRIRILKRYNLTVKEDYSDLWQSFRSKDDSPIQTRVSISDSLFFGEDMIWIRVIESSVMTAYSNANQSPLITTKWGQGSPWNAAAPIDIISGYRSLTCCAAVAVAQVLRYFNKKGTSPTDLWHTAFVSSSIPVVKNNHVYVTTTLSRSGYTSNSSRWNQMPDTQIGSHTEYVARLMLDIGNRINVYYSANESVVFPDTSVCVVPNLPQCGISSSFASYTFSQVRTDINAKKPVIVSARTGQGLSGVGHIWVIDGCHDLSQIYLTTETYYYISPNDYYSYSNVVDVYTCDEMMSINPDAYHGMQTVSSTTHTSKDLHMNWGWDGNEDGFYNMLDSNDWTATPGNTPLNFLYTRLLNYNIATGQLN